MIWVAAYIFTGAAIALIAWRSSEARKFPPVKRVVVALILGVFWWAALALTLYFMVAMRRTL